MKVSLVILTAVFVLLSSASRADRFSFGLGGGVPYAGILGSQFSILNTNSRARFSLGLIGVGVGFDYFVSRKCSLGATVLESITLGDRVNYSLGANCGFGLRQNGFNIGFDLVTHQPDYSVNSDNDNLDTRVTAALSIGYRF